MGKEEEPKGKPYKQRRWEMLDRHYDENNPDFVTPVVKSDIEEGKKPEEIDPELSDLLDEIKNSKPPLETIQPGKNIQVTRENALEHIGAVEKSKGIKISDPAAYFKQEIIEIENRLRRERALDPDGKEMAAIRKWMSTEQYFEWLEEVLEYQKAYLAALENQASPEYTTAIKSPEAEGLVRVTDEVEDTSASEIEAKGENSLQKAISALTEDEKLGVTPYEDLKRKLQEAGFKVLKDIADTDFNSYPLEELEKAAEIFEDENKARNNNKETQIYFNTLNELIIEKIGAEEEKLRKAVQELEAKINSLPDTKPENKN